MHNVHISCLSQECKPLKDKIYVFCLLMLDTWKPTVFIAFFWLQETKFLLQFPQVKKETLGKTK